jgi:hypothetical protein
MACPHSKPRGRCDLCRMEALEDYYGVPEDHIEEGDDDS